MPDTPTTEPTSLRAGDTWAWQRDLADYPASTWTLSYHFRNAASKFDITATADGDLHAVSIAKATTALRAAGWYDWIAVVTSATERHEVNRGRTQILPDFAPDAVYDARTFARKMLDAVETALLGQASAQQLDLVEATLADRAMKRDKAALMALRSALRQEVAAEDNRNRIKAGGAARNRLVAVL